MTEKRYFGSFCRHRYQELLDKYQNASPAKVEQEREKYLKYFTDHCAKCSKFHVTCMDKYI